MNSLNSKFEAKIALLKQNFVQELPQRTGELKACIDGYVRSFPDTRQDQLIGITAESHKLTGAAGTFGFHSLSENARDLEIYSRRMAEDTTTLKDEGHFQNSLKEIEQYWLQIDKTVKGIKTPETD